METQSLMTSLYLLKGPDVTALPLGGLALTEG